MNDRVGGHVAGNLAANFTRRVGRVASVSYPAVFSWAPRQEPSSWVCGIWFYSKEAIAKRKPLFRHQQRYGIFQSFFHRIAEDGTHRAVQNTMVERK